MVNSPCVIILDRATSAERNAVHEMIKTHASGWWHHFTNVWIAGGHSTLYWNRLLAPLIPAGQSAILVLKLPEDKTQRQYNMYTRGNNERSKWIKEVLGAHLGDPLQDERVPSPPSVDNALESSPD
jgi:hypothetical protein